MRRIRLALRAGSLTVRSCEDSLLRHTARFQKVRTMLAVTEFLQRHISQ